MCAVCIIGSVYWKLVRVAVNVCSVHYRVCVLEIGACGCKCVQCALWGLCAGNWCVWL